MKTLEALAAGAAVVTTSLGAQGLGARSGERPLIADGPDEIADAIVRVLIDRDLRARLRAAGRSLASDGRARALRARALEGVLQRVARGDRSVGGES